MSNVVRISFCAVLVYDRTLWSPAEFLGNLQQFSLCLDLQIKGGESGLPRLPSYHFNNQHHHSFKSQTLGPFPQPSPASGLGYHGALALEDRR